MNILKKILYKTVQNDSRNMEKVGDFFNWEWLQEEAKKNQEDPSKALRKAALSAATMYAGGALGGAMGGAGAGAGAVAGSAAPVVGGTVGTVATTATATAAEEAAKLAAQQALQEAAQQGALNTAANGGGLLGQFSQQATSPWVSQIAENTSGILGSNTGPAVGQLSDLSSTWAPSYEASNVAAQEATRAMVPGLNSTGPLSQADMLAKQNAGFGLSGLAKTADAAAGAQGVGQGGLLGSQALKMADVGLDLMAGNSTTGKSMREMQMAQGLLSPQQQPGMPPPQMQRPPQQQQQGPQFQGYQSQPLNTQPGKSFLGGGMDEEMKAKLRAMGYPV